MSPNIKKTIIGLRRKVTLAFPPLADVYRYSKAVKSTLLRLTKSRKFFSEKAHRTIQLEGYNNTFCGYYDHSPFLPDTDDLLLVHATNAPAWKRPNSNVPLDIWLIERESGQAVKQLGRTFAWNWQQGSRAHWLDSNTYIYNTFDPLVQDYQAIIGYLDKKNTEKLPLAVQESDCNGGIYSISFAALAQYRPDYGYRNRLCTEADILKNRIRRYCLRSGQLRDFVGVEELVPWTVEQDGQLPQMYKLNHLLASPSGKKLLFLFRYFVNNQRITDLFCLDVIDGNWRRLLHNSAVSHYCWLDDKTVLFTGNAGEGYGYYQLDVISETRKLILSGLDGHPVLLPDSWIITDTYPDRYGIRTLYSFSLKSSDQQRVISHFVEPFGFHGEMRCDLHPSLSPSGRWVQVDMAIGHRRCIGLICLGEVLDAQ